MTHNWHGWHPLVTEHKLFTNYTCCRLQSEYQASSKQVQQALCSIKHQMTNEQVGLEAKRPFKDR